MRTPLRDQEFKWAWIAWAAIVLCAAGPASAGQRVQVRGIAKLDVQATREPGSATQGELVLQGTLSDDVEQPLPRERIRIELEHVGYPRDPQVAEALRGAKPCAAANVADRPHADDVAWVRTDEGGRFCVRLGLVMDRYAATLSFAGTRLLDAVRAEVRFDLSRRSLLLRFDPEPRVVSLDAKELLLEAVAEVDEDGVPHPVSGKRLVLSSEQPTALDEGTTNTSGRALFRVPMERLGAPGRGELRASFAGDSDTSFAEHKVEITRKAIVSLRANAPGEAQVPEDGIPLRVDVSARRGAKTSELIGEGSVEARVADVIVGAAPVEVGQAQLALTFASGGDFADVRLRYVPASPWFDGRTETTVRVPVKSPSPLRRLPLVLAAIAVVGWLALGRRPPRLVPKDAPPAEKNGALGGTATIEVVRALPHQHRPRWIGLVRDAHDGTPIEGAEVTVERAGFDASSVLGRATTDRLGRFELELREARPDDTLVVEGPLHSALRQRVPAPGELAIAIVTRKRKIVERLVRWAKRRAGAFDSVPEPTPAQVRDAAKDDFATVQWADEVERAAFDRGVVDAKAEADIQALMSRAQGKPAAK